MAAGVFLAVFVVVILAVVFARFTCFVLFSRLRKPKPKGKKMAKEDKVLAFVQAVQAAEVQVLTEKGGELFDGAFAEGVASVPATSGGDPSKIFSQAEMDQAKADAAAAQAGVDQVALQAAVDAANQSLAALQVKLDEMTAKDQAAEGVVSDFQVKLKASQDAFNAVFAFIGGPAPAPAPTPAPVPADPTTPADPVPASLASKPKLSKHDD